MDDNQNIAIILLAAGSSSRLGQPKQLVQIKGKPLLVKMVEAAISSQCSPVLVVLGAYFEKIKPTLKHLPIHILENKNWANGMGSSVACGMDFLVKNHPKVEAVILLVTDQYYLSEKNIAALIAVHQRTEKEIVASKYHDAIGVPALFSNKMFPDLMALSGKAGAKKVIEENLDKLSIVDFEDGIFDLDTPQDLEKLRDK